MTRPTDIANEELWEFPMDFPLNAVGEARFPLAQIVSDIIRRHVPDFDPASIEIKPSSKGKYVAIRARFRVDNKDQINGLYADMAAEPAIKMAL